jgi:hypothetical protein
VATGIPSPLIKDIDQLPFLFTRHEAHQKQVKYIIDGMLHSDWLDDEN